MKLQWLKDILPHTLDLTANQLRVLMDIFNHTNADGQNAHPSQATIAADLGISEKQVGRILSQLRDRQLIVRTARGNRKAKHADTYALGTPATAHNGHPDVGYEAAPHESHTGHMKPSYRTRETFITDISDLITDIQDVPPSDPVHQIRISSDPDADPWESTAPAPAQSGAEDDDAPAPYEGPWDMLSSSTARPDPWGPDPWAA